MCLRRCEDHISLLCDGMELLNEVDVIDALGRDLACQSHSGDRECSRFPQLPTCLEHCCQNTSSHAYFDDNIKYRDIR
jgi:hypothetical protein